MTNGTVEPAPSRRPAPGRKSWLLLTGLLLAVIVMAYVFNGRFGQNPRLVESPLIGEPFPALTLEYLEQEGSLDFADLEGQVLVVNFWASWCFPCRAEHPILTAASSAYADRGVHFVGIVYQDRAGTASEFLDEFGRGTNYSYVMDDDSRATVELGVFGIPETYFVGADGVIRGKVQGEVNARVVIDTIDALLEGREPEL